jgi:hypothetical protein
VQVAKETSVSTPVSWVPRALLSNVPHLQTVSMFQSQTATTATTTQPRTYTNQCPNPVADTAAVAANSAATMIDVLANDTDPDRNALTVSAVSQPANGTAAIAGNKVNYTPRAGFSGTDTFTYTVSDGFCSTRTATVTVSVAAAPPPVTPSSGLVCAPLSYTIPCRGSTEINVSRSVTGGTAPYTYTMPARGLFGTITDRGNGRFLYEAGSQCFANEFVTYTATDSTGAKCEGKVEIIDPKRRDGEQ